MARLGKRFLSAFIETTEDKKVKDSDGGAQAGGPAAGMGAGAGSVGGSAAGSGVAAGGGSVGGSAAAGGVPGSEAAWGSGVIGSGAAGGGAADQRFAEYFDKLFSDANIPGPDYYEFSRMIRAMQLIPDEQSRYNAAYAGLQVQGLDKQKLLSTAAEYMRVLTADASQFQTTVEAALQEKVNSRMVEAEEKGRRIQALSQEILKLQEEIGAMQREIGENKDKLTASCAAYAAESGRRKQEIEADIQKINHYIH
ncbi:MAG TPA: hypothetical protein VL727_14800 [Puia sp.]|nr:hypothetical protein [Puia sp.]